MRWVTLILKWILRRIHPHLGSPAGALEIRWESIPFRFETRWYVESPSHLPGRTKGRNHAPTL